VTDGSEQDQEARQVEALREQGIPIFRALQEYVVGARTDDPDSPTVARQVSEALDVERAEVIAALQRLALVDRATLRGVGSLGGYVMGAATLSGEGTLAAGASVITLTDSDSLRPENLARLSAKVTRDGIAGLSIMQVLALVLLWLLTIGAPFVQQALPPEAQTLLNNEYGTVGLGIALTLVIVSRKR
jgi:hypothetical protein